MNNPKNVLLLVGSPRGENSTSASLGNYLVEKLEELGMKSEKTFIHRLVNRPEKVQELFSMIENADLIILTFPLYVDSLPAPVIKAMELIKSERDRIKSSKSQNFVAISNSGFPESKQISVALEICQIFASEAGFTWKGGIAFGGGEAVHGIPLKERGGMVRNVMKGLDLASEASSEGKNVSQEALDLISKNLIPVGLYKTMGNLGWRMRARKYNTRKRLKDKPYSF
ncbi:MAG: NAD(P)H-dependent oxidoreductase [Promethearchaeota archaeon]